MRILVGGMVLEGICFDCGKHVDRINRHRLNPDLGYKDPSNIRYLCTACHIARHSMGEIASYNLLPLEKTRVYKQEIKQVTGSYITEFQRLEDKFKEAKEKLKVKYDLKYNRIARRYGIKSDDSVPVYSYPNPISKLFSS